MKCLILQSSFVRFFRRHNWQRQLWHCGELGLYLAGIDLIVQLQHKQYTLVDKLQ